MKNEVMKTVGTLVKDGFTEENEDTATVVAAVIGLAAFAAPYVVEMVHDLSERAVEFTDRVMAMKYRFKAGTVVLEPAETPRDA